MTKPLRLKCANDPHSSYVEATINADKTVNLDVVDGHTQGLVDLSAKDAIDLAAWLNAAALEIEPDAFGPGPIEVVPARVDLTPTPLFQLYLARISAGSRRVDALEHAKNDLRHIESEAHK
jgi:hypothetical protein